TGKPFWDIYRRNDPPLWRAYLDAVRYFEMDGWFTYGYVGLRTQGDCRSWRTEVVSRTEDRIVERTICSTPDGDLWSETTYYRADPPTQTRKWVKSFPDDFPKLRHFFPKIVGYDPTPLREMREAVGNAGVIGAGCAVPGMHDLFGWFDGGLEAAVAAYVEHYNLLREFVSWQEEQALRVAEMVLDAEPDFFMLGASGL
ncbi:MAG: uroporphyrinogen decarboxylase family protein, partial [Armatimonadota bacterium]